MISHVALLAIAVAIAGLVAGYGFFRMEIARLETVQPQSLAGTYGIVVLTGDSDRIRTGLELLEEGMGERLLISGVNKRTSMNALFRAADYRPTLKSCCVDIGHVARDTRGNGAEAANWVNRRNYDRIIVVTSDYHMPRSLLELSHSMPAVELVPVFARPREANSMQAASAGEHRSSGSWIRHSLKEYGKYLAAYGRIMLEGPAGPVIAVAKAGE